MVQSELRRQVVSALGAAIVDHDQGRFERIGVAYNRLAAAASEHQNIDPELQVAIDFLDSWSDSSKHEWAFYEPLGRDDWPRLSRSLAACLEAGEPIDDDIRQRFTFPSREGLLSRLRKLLTGSA